MSSNNPGSRNHLLMKDSGHTEWKPWAGDWEGCVQSAMATIRYIRGSTPQSAQV